MSLAQHQSAWQVTSSATLGRTDEAAVGWGGVGQVWGTGEGWDGRKHFEGSREQVPSEMEEAANTPAGSQSMTQGGGRASAASAVPSTSGLLTRAYRKPFTPPVRGSHASPLRNEPASSLDVMTPALGI